MHFLQIMEGCSIFWTQSKTVFCEIFPGTVLECLMLLLKLSGDFRYDCFVCMGIFCLDILGQVNEEINRPVLLCDILLVHQSETILTAETIQEKEHLCSCQESGVQLSFVSWSRFFSLILLVKYLN